MIPDHFLDFGAAEQSQFYPSGALPTRATSEAVSTVVTLLQGILTAVAHRVNALLALTTAWVSRVPLTVLRHVSTRLQA